MSSDRDRDAAIRWIREHPEAAEAVLSMVRADRGEDVIGEWGLPAAGDLVPFAVVASG